MTVFLTISVIVATIGGALMALSLKVLLKPSIRSFLTKVVFLLFLLLAFILCASAFRGLSLVCSSLVVVLVVSIPLATFIYLWMKNPEEIINVPANLFDVPGSKVGNTKNEKEAKGK